MSNKPSPHDYPLWVLLVQAASRALGVVAAGMILVSIGVVCHMVFVRAVLGESSIWQTEFATFSIVGATFLGAPYILLTRGHVAVDVVPLLVGPRPRRWLHLVGSVVGLAFCALFFAASVPWWYETWNSGQTTSSIWAARVWIPYLAVPVGLGLLCLQYLAEMWLVIKQLDYPFGLHPDERM